jgi:hypothetical protein
MKLLILTEKEKKNVRLIGSQHQSLRSLQHILPTLELGIAGLSKLVVRLKDIWLSICIGPRRNLYIII